MLSAETPPTEGARYAAGLVCIPGLWAGSGVWRGFASHLGRRAARRLVLAPRSLLALLAGRPVPAPAGPAATAWADLPPALRASTGAEDAAAVREVVWGRVRPVAAAGVPTLVVAGARDPLL